MGWRPWEVNQATFPEFIFSFRGWQRSQGIDPDEQSKPQLTRLDLLEIEKKIEAIHGAKS